MDRYSFGQLVKALREQRISTYHKLTQAEFSKRLNRDKKVIENLEQGRAVNLSEDLLVDIANSLELTTGERTEFFAMASNVSEEKRMRDEIPPPERVRDEMISIMEKLQVPSMLMDRFGDMVAIHPSLFVAYNLEANLLMTPPRNPVVTANIMRLLFAPEFEGQRRMFGENWDAFASQSMKIFRTMSLRQRSSSHFYRLFGEMINFPKFAETWLDVYARQTDHYIDNTVDIKWVHPALGELTFVSSTILGINSFSDLTLFSMVPASKNTYDTMGRILRETGNASISIIPTWPRKDYF